MSLSLEELPLPVRLIPGLAMNEEDLLRFCAVNDSVGMEREPNGDLLIMSPSGLVTNKNVRFSRLLDKWAEADGRGIGFDSNGGFTFPDVSLRSPDRAWFELTRWNARSNDQQQRFSPLCSDFVVELRSPGNHLSALHQKMQWIDNGAQIAWLIDPIVRAVSVCRPHGAPEVHQNPTSIHADGIMAGFSLMMSRLWGS